ncbi:Retrotransposon-derived protein PEG10 [Rhizoctonia solani]|uniref:Retrotransposon-derived protein PEG10 n=1 Tax=Rhizoctonia solani TaxID=456999 RepID=A0A8H8NQC5_9AGAM|nr:Retrotransposon-derived protein PEG10 [Rhizoctonia solani]QRW17530.1 Retrotransposon-derived protein PEG10 [Rhizoctonia solani]
MRKYELSDHRPILAEFRKLPNESPSEQKPVKWDMGRFKVFAKEFVNHNRWAVLSKAEIETGEELSKVTDQMAKTLDLVAEDLSLKTQPNNLPPVFKKKLRKLLKRKNTLASNIAMDFSQGRSPCESLLKKFEMAKDHLNKAQKQWRKDLCRKEVHNLCNAIRGNKMKKVWSNLKSKMGIKKSGQQANPVRNKDGELCISQEDILRAVTEHYDNLVNGDPGTSRDREYWSNIELDQSMGNRAEDLGDLNAAISWRDILLAIRQMQRGTAPSIDGLQTDVLKEVLNQECFECVNQEGEALEGITYALEENKLPHKPLTFFGTVVAFLAYKGKGLGRGVADLEMYMGKKATHGQDYIGNPMWVRWTKGDSNQHFGNKKLPAYAMLNKECQAMIVNVSKGWIPSYNIGFVCSWLISFDVKDVDFNLLKLFIRLSCEASKKLQVTLMLVKQSIEDQSRWEMRMTGAGDQRQLVLEHREVLTHHFNNGSTPLLAQIKAFDGCYVCWDVL